MEIKLASCERENTCYRCDNIMCFHCGDAAADCMMFRCLYHGAPNETKCLHCMYNANNKQETKT